MSPYDFCRSFCFFFILTTTLVSTINSTDAKTTTSSNSTIVVVGISADSRLPATAAATGTTGSTIIENDLTTEKYQIDKVITEGTPAGRSLFSPKVDYNNKWKPVGHGDPLKKDPTYDYSPPVLDRVRYWGGIGGGSNGDSNSNSDDDNNRNSASDNSNESSNKNINSDSSIETSLLSNGDYYLASSTISSQKNNDDTNNNNNNHQIKQLKKNDILLLGVSSKQRPLSSFNKQNLYHQLQQQSQQSTQQQLHQSQQPSHQQPQSIQHQQHQQHYNRKTEMMKPNYYHPSPYEYNMATAPLSRRNYYPQQLPVVLMPPPMQTLSPLNLDNNSQQFNLQNKQHNWSQRPSTMVTHGGNNNDDTIAQESMQFTNYVLNPNSNLINFHKQVNNLSTGTASPMIIASSPSNKMNSYRKKPWIHELLQKEEVIKTVKMPPTTTTKPIATKTVVTMEKSPTIYESHALLYHHDNSSPWKGDSSIFTNIVTPTTLLENEYHPYRSSSQIPPETSTYFTPTIPPMATADAPSTKPTTEETFSHYKQEFYTTERSPSPTQPSPNAPPLLGQTYLTIEGHSNVKTYGQNDDTDKSKRVTAKIVPVQSTVDPIVNRVVSEDDLGNRFEVKHLHKKIMNLGEIELTTEQTKYSTKFKSTSSAASPMNSLLSLLDTSFGDFLNIDEDPTDNNSTVTTTLAPATTITTNDDHDKLLLTLNSTLINLNSNEMIKQEKS